MALQEKPGYSPGFFSSNQGGVDFKKQRWLERHGQQI
jgi:hypothetical protein